MPRLLYHGGEVRALGVTTCAVITWQRGAPSHTLGTIMHGEMAAWSCAHQCVCRHCVRAVCQGRLRSGRLLPLCGFLVLF